MTEEEKQMVRLCIAAMEKAIPEHYDGGYEGTHACNAISSWHGPCDCGAAEIIESLNEAIKIAKTLLEKVGG